MKKLAERQVKRFKEEYLIDLAAKIRGDKETHEEQKLWLSGFLFALGADTYEGAYDDYIKETETFTTHKNTVKIDSNDGIIGEFDYYVVRLYKNKAVTEKKIYRSYEDISSQYKKEKI